MMASHPPAGVHFKDAVEHLHLTDMRFILQDLSVLGGVRIVALSISSHEQTQ